MMVKLYTVIFFLGLQSSAFAQPGSPDVNALAAPFKHQKKAKVMILGTFHFNDGVIDIVFSRYLWSKLQGNSFIRGDI